MKHEDPEVTCPDCEAEITEWETMIADSDGPDRARALLGLAHAYLHRDDTKMSLAATGAAEDIYRDHNDEVGIAQSRLHTSFVCHRLERNEEAIQEAEKARETFARANMAEEVASCHVSKAVAYRGLGDHEARIAELELARIIHSQTGMVLDMATCDGDIAESLVELERYVDAAERLGSARATFVKFGLAPGVARVDFIAGRLLKATGQYDLSINKLRDASLIYESLGLHYQHACCLDEMGQVLYETDAPELSLKAHEDASNIFRKIRARIDVAISEFQMIRVLGDLGRYKEVLRVARRARKTFVAEKMFGHMAYVDLDSAYSWAATGKVDTGRRKLASAKRIFSSTDPNPEGLTEVERQMARIDELERNANREAS